MRLTKRQHQTLLRVLHRHFGERATILLFGSRTRDDERGGDYDILVRTEIADPDRLVEARLKALAELHASPEFAGEPIDLVLQSPLHRTPLPIHEAAWREGVRL